MRTLLLISFSAAALSGCLTTQENPNYEHSTVYRDAPTATQQYASAAPTQITASHASTYHEPVTSNTVITANHQTAPTYSVLAHPDPTPVAPSVSAPTDSAYAGTEVTGTPGFMAMQGEAQSTQSVAFAQAAPTLPAAQIVTSSPLGAAGTPVSYDYTRNLITADALTTGQYPSETVRVMQGARQGVEQGAGQNYTVQPGDTVYSLSRKTCVGVHVIQSMNGLDNNYGIKIGQSLTLPTSVC